MVYPAIDPAINSAINPAINPAIDHAVESAVNPAVVTVQPVAAIPPTVWILTLSIDHNS